MHVYHSRSGGSVTSITQSNCASVPIKPDELKILFEWEVFQKIKEWTRIAPGEISGMLMVERDKHLFIIKDVFLVQQENTSSFTDIDDEALGHLIFELAQLDKEDDLDRCGKLYGWWHSHASMGTFWSGTDHGCIDSKIDDRGPDYWVSIVNNKKGEILARLDIKHPRMMINNIKWQVKEAIPQYIMDFCKQEYDVKVSQKNYSNIIGGYGQWDDEEMCGHGCMPGYRWPRTYNDVLKYNKDELCDVVKHYQDELKFTGISGIAVWDTSWSQWRAWGDFIEPGQQAVYCPGNGSFAPVEVGTIYEHTYSQTKIFRDKRTPLKETIATNLSIDIKKQPVIDSVLVFLTTDDNVRLVVKNQQESTDAADESSLQEAYDFVSDYARDKSDSLLKQRINIWLHKMNLQQLRGVIGDLITDETKQKNIQSIRSLTFLRQAIQKISSKDPWETFITVWSWTNTGWYCTSCVEPLSSNDIEVCSYCGCNLEDAEDATVADCIIAEDATVEIDLAEEETQDGPESKVS